jgi:hypothetical protein
MVFSQTGEGASNTMVTPRKRLGLKKKTHLKEEKEDRCLNISRTTFGDFCIILDSQPSGCFFCLCEPVISNWLDDLSVSM